MSLHTTRISFYVLAADDPSARLAYACRLIEKAYKLQQRIHVVTGDAATARTLDDLLWTFRQGSFVPHMIWDGGTKADAPVTIAAANAGAPEADLLLNLADEVPADFARFPRVAEIIDGIAECRQAGRQRHRFYRQQGLEPETHEVS
ncbi:MAG: DNA polymerase III subunit chi [Gammaproteobacteria bacterium]|nr:DNA polymerase III subunit chi [Gammaproteobacteria bacterium]